MIDKTIEILSTKRGAIYSRYSIDLQNDKSIDDQVSACKKYGAKNNISVRDENIYADCAISGSIKNRPGLHELLEDVKNNCFDVLLVDDLSRITRDTKQLLDIVEKVSYYGISIISVSENIDTSDERSKLLYQFKAILNEQFLVDLKARTRGGQIGKLERGYNVGSLPPGYTTVPDRNVIINKGHKTSYCNKPIIDESSAKIVIQIFENFADGKSVSEIVRTLNENHVPSKRNVLGAWSPSTIHEMLRNERYIGKWNWGKTLNRRNPETRNICKEFRDEPLLSQTFEDRRIISDELWERVQVRLKEVSRVWPGGKGKKGFETQKGSRVMAFPQHLLEGAMTCSMCGNTIGMVSGRHGGYYGCISARRGRCDNRNEVRRELVEQKILTTIADMLDNTECLSKIFKKTEIMINELVKTVPDDIFSLERNLKEINRHIANLINFIAVTDEPTEAEICNVRHSLKEYQSQKTTLENNLEELKSKTSISYKPPSMDWVRNKVHNIKETLELKTEKSALLLLLRQLNTSVMPQHS